MAQFLLDRPLMGERANKHPISEFTAHFQCLFLVSKGFRKAVVDTILDKYTVRRDASLTGVAELSQDSRLHHSFDLSIVKINERYVSA